MEIAASPVRRPCAAPELSPRYGRLYAYLHDDVTRKLPSPRLVGHLLEGGLAATDADVGHRPRHTLLERGCECVAELADMRQAIIELGWRRRFTALEALAAT